MSTGVYSNVCNKGTKGTHPDVHNIHVCIGVNGMTFGISGTK